MSLKAENTCATCDIIIQITFTTIMGDGKILITAPSSTVTGYGLSRRVTVVVLLTGFYLLGKNHVLFVNTGMFI